MHTAFEITNGREYHKYTSQETISDIFLFFSCVCRKKNFFRSQFKFVYCTLIWIYSRWIYSWSHNNPIERSWDESYMTINDDCQSTELQEVWGEGRKSFDSFNSILKNVLVSWTRSSTCTKIVLNALKCLSLLVMLP